MASSPAAVERQIVAERLTSQLLTGPPSATAEGVAERLLAIQGQDPRGARLAVRGRTEGLTAAAVDHGLSDERSLLITWLCRGTLHLVRTEDYTWLHMLTTPPLRTANARRLAQEGVSPAAAERGVDVIERSLADEGPLSRAQLRERIAAAGVRTEGQALVQVLLLASLRGLIVRGPMIGSEQVYVLVRDWLGERGGAAAPGAMQRRERGGAAAPAAMQRDRALEELARRYLRGHGPADERDLARWAGLPLRDARRGLEGIASELVQRHDGLVDLRSRPPAGELPPPRLLGAFDPLLLGWCSRDAIVGKQNTIVTVNGLFRPFALVRGRAEAVWTLQGGKVTIAPFGRLTCADTAALETDASDVQRFLGRPE